MSGKHIIDRVVTVEMMTQVAFKDERDGRAPSWSRTPHFAREPAKAAERNRILTIRQTFETNCSRCRDAGKTLSAPRGQELKECSLLQCCRTESKMRWCKTFGFRDPESCLTPLARRFSSLHLTSTALPEHRAPGASYYPFSKGDDSVTIRAPQRE